MGIVYVLRTCSILVFFLFCELLSNLLLSQMAVEKLCNVIVIASVSVNGVRISQNWN